VPSETRKLAFSQAELQSALVGYALRSDMKLPNANIDKVVLSDQGDRTVRLIFVRNTGDDVREVEFSQEHVAAAETLEDTESKTIAAGQARVIDGTD